MAACDQGYLCEVCGEEVEHLAESDLYLRYVLGEIDARALLAQPERHLTCNPVQAQFIVDDNFPPVFVEGPFDKRDLDPQDVARQEALVTRAWRRLQEVRELNLPISEYPLSAIERAAILKGNSQRDV
ncbi:MAG: hypothetical protein Tsb009_20090 [Planctomycetaceae bacterium]